MLACGRDGAGSLIGPVPFLRAIRGRFCWRWFLPVALLVVAFHFFGVQQGAGPVLLRCARAAPAVRPLRAKPANVRLRPADEQTMAALSQQGLRWPYPPGDFFAQLVAALHKSGAAHVMVDFTFFEESDGAQDQLLAAVAAASPSVVLARTEERPPVFWSDAYQSAHPRFFQKPHTGFVEFPADEDGVARSYVAPGSLAAAAFDPPSATPGGLVRWPRRTREQLRSLGKFSCFQPRPTSSRRPAHDRADQRWPPPISSLEAVAKGVGKAEPFLTGDLGWPCCMAVTVFVGANASGNFTTSNRCRSEKLELRRAAALDGAWEQPRRRWIHHPDPAPGHAARRRARDGPRDLGRPGSRHARAAHRDGGAARRHSAGRILCRPVRRLVFPAGHPSGGPRC